MQTEWESQRLEVTNYSVLKNRAAGINFSGAWQKSGDWRKDGSLTFSCRTEAGATLTFRLHSNEPFNAGFYWRSTESFYCSQWGELIDGGIICTVVFLCLVWVKERSKFILALWRMTMLNILIGLLLPGWEFTRFIPLKSSKDLEVSFLNKEALEQIFKSLDLHGDVRWDTLTKLSLETAILCYTNTVASQIHIQVDQKGNYFH